MSTDRSSRAALAVALCGVALCVCAWLARPGKDVAERTEDYIARADGLVPECKERFRYDVACASLHQTDESTPALESFFTACGVVDETAGETTRRDGVPVTPRTIRLRSTALEAASAALKNAEAAGYRPISVTIDPTSRAGCADVTIEFLEFAK